MCSHSSLTVPLARIRRTKSNRLTKGHVRVFTLHAEHIREKNHNRKNETTSSSPPYNRVANEVILDLRITPTTHSETESSPWPVQGLRCKDILFIRIRYQCVVGSHHCHIQVPEIAEERSP